jgi:hypothetical protein
MIDSTTLRPNDALTYRIDQTDEIDQINVNNQV